MNSNNPSTFTKGALVDMANNNWVTYLPTANICDAIVSILLNDPKIQSVFSTAIYANDRDDYTSGESPALSIYTLAKTLDRSPIGNISEYINFDMYFPINIDRDNANRIFRQISQYIMVQLRTQYFFSQLCEYLVPLPPIKSDYYETVLEWRNTYGSSLKWFAQYLEYKLPYVLNRDNIVGDTWRATLITDYYADLMKYYDMLEYFGINIVNDINKFRDTIIREVSYNIQVKSSDGTETQEFEGEIDGI